jgi:hypothetical protein
MVRRPVDWVVRRVLRLNLWSPLAEEDEAGVGPEVVGKLLGTDVQSRFAS